MAEWVAVRLSDLSDVEPPRKTRGHSFTSPKRMAWLSYCRHCGHVTKPGGHYIERLVTRIGCDYERDARFQAWRRNPRAFAGKDSSHAP